MSHDQPDNARRIERLVVGATLSPQEFLPGRVAQAVEQLLASTEVQARCTELAQRLDAQNARQDTAMLIEQLAESR